MAKKNFFGINLSIKTKDFKNALKGATKATKDFGKTGGKSVTSSVNKMSSAMEGGKNVFQTFQKTLGGVKTSLDGMKVSMTGFNKRIASGMKDTVQMMTSFRSQAKKTGKHTKDLGEKAKDASKKFKLLKKSIKLPLIALGAFGAAFIGFKKALDMSKEAAAIEVQSKAFANLMASHGAVASSTVKELKKASKGTLTTFGLMTTASRAILLGISPDKLTKLMEVARAASKAMGTSVAGAFSDIALGLGRQSRLILDNLGIIVRTGVAYQKYADKIGVAVGALTDFEKAQAFQEEALRQGMKTVEDRGEDVEDFVDQLAQMQVMIKEFGQRISIIIKTVMGGIFELSTKLGVIDKIKDFLETKAPQYIAEQFSKATKHLLKVVAAMAILVEHIKQFHKLSFGGQLDKIKQLFIALGKLIGQGFMAAVKSGAKEMAKDKGNTLLKGIAPGIALVKDVKEKIEGSDKNYGEDRNIATYESKLKELDKLTASKRAPKKSLWSWALGEYREFDKHMDLIDKIEKDLKELRGKRDELESKKSKKEYVLTRLATKSDAAALKEKKKLNDEILDIKVTLEAINTGKITTPFWLSLLETEVIDTGKTVEEVIANMTKAFADMDKVMNAGYDIDHLKVFQDKLKSVNTTISIPTMSYSDQQAAIDAGVKAMEASLEHLKQNALNVGALFAIAAPNLAGISSYTLILDEMGKKLQKIKETQKTINEGAFIETLGGKTARKLTTDINTATSNLKRLKESQESSLLWDKKDLKLSQDELAKAMDKILADMQPFYYSMSKASRDFFDEMQIQANEAAKNGSDSIQKGLHQWVRDFDNTRGRLEGMGRQLAQGLTNSLDNFFFNAIKGKISSLQEAFKSLFNSILRMATKFTAEFIVSNLIKLIIPDAAVDATKANTTATSTLTTATNTSTTWVQRLITTIKGWVTKNTSTPTSTGPGMLARPDTTPTIGPGMLARPDTPTSTGPGMLARPDTTSTSPGMLARPDGNLGATLSSSIAVASEDKSLFERAKDSLLKIKDGAFEGLTNAKDAIGKKLKGFGKFLGKGFSGIFNSIKSLFGKGGSSGNNTSSIWDTALKIGSTMFAHKGGIVDLQNFAKGGITSLAGLNNSAMVTKRPTIAAISERGQKEAIVPLDKFADLIKPTTFVINAIDTQSFGEYVEANKDILASAVLGVKGSPAIGGLGSSGRGPL